MSCDEFDEVLEYFEERSYRGLQYRHLPDYRRNLERGTVLVDDEVVRGFPKVPRTLYLETGIPQHFNNEVVVEEKMDGYNTRVVRIDGEIYAFTRGGIICPYTTWKVKELLDFSGFFLDHPDLMLCGEMVGPHNPYTVHDYPGVESLEFRSFDIRSRELGSPLQVQERRELCNEYGFPQVELYGSYDMDKAAAAVREIIHELDSGGREGVVIKSSSGEKQLKYNNIQC